ncbi:MAG: VOC family protein [Gemmatimonadaceae bacterium]|nr:VOC family protein [Chitinophagaceae bacterium]
MATFQKISPNLWFDSNAEEAANFYISIFPNSKIGKITRYGTEGFEIHHRPAGTVMVIEFFLDGQQFLGLNGGPVFKFNESVSFVVNCADQKEIDYFWDKLNEGGDPAAQQCGWLKDKFGLSWQVVPIAMDDMMSGDSAASGRVMNAMLQMKKLDIAKLEAARKG